MKAPLPPRSARQPQRKMFLAFLICARPIFSEKGKDIFLWGSALQVFGQSAGLQCGLGFAKTIFWGLDFRKTETNLFLDFVRAEEGSGEESARASFLNCARLTLQCSFCFSINRKELNNFHLVLFNKNNNKVKQQSEQNKVCASGEYRWNVI